MTNSVQRVWRVCVFCGGATGIDPLYAESAARLGAELAQRGHEIVYGGSALGCMGALANGALGAGGRVIGVIPVQLVDSERPHPGLTESVIVPDLASRKIAMLARSDVVMVLPGGTGTFDELLEALTMKRLGLLKHPMVLVNTRDFFSPFLALLKHMVTEGFAHSSQQNLFAVVADVEGAMLAVARSAASLRFDQLVP